ncbi:hypothetical protein Pan241w_22260 [Gimesia alba]|uniref:Uncharacterized protein n=2 Tax=Gimesia alba TaxID=2527973 RepID=A0A517RE42_9PLAN|nr:hypothetical protein Pan241w_22260 [Gimesia alba]
MYSEFSDYESAVLLLLVTIAITTGLNVGQTMWDLIRRAARERNFWLMVVSLSLFVMPSESYSQCLRDDIVDLQVQSFGSGVVSADYGIQVAYTFENIYGQLETEYSWSKCTLSGCSYASIGQLCSISGPGLPEMWWAVQGYPSTNLALNYGYGSVANGQIGSAAYQCDCNGNPSGCPPGHTWSGTSCDPDGPLPPCGPGYTRDELGFCVPDPNNPPDPCGEGYVRDEYGVCNPDPENPPDPCPTGQTRDEYGNCVTEPCPPGHTADEYGNCIEDPCPAGQSRDENGNCVDDPCPAGQSRNDQGECVDDPCPEGQQRDDEGQCVPIPCPNEGEVRDIDGNCVVPCARDEIRGPDGNCVPGECQEGYHRDESGQCVPGCPEGMTEDENGVCQCPEGQIYDEEFGGCIPTPCDDADGDGCCDEIDPDPANSECGCTRTETDTCGECKECEKTMDDVLNDYIDLFEQFGVDITPFQSGSDQALSWIIPLPTVGGYFSSGQTVTIYSDERSMDAGPLKTALGTARAAFRNILLVVLILISVRSIMRVFLG